MFVLNEAGDKIKIFQNRFLFSLFKREKSKVSQHFKECHRFRDHHVMISPLIMFAQKLKQLRTEKVLAQDELAKQVHVSRSAVAKWEQGRGYPTEESIADLCALFGVSKDELIDDDKEALEQRRGEARKKKNPLDYQRRVNAGVLLRVIPFPPDLWVHS